MPRPVGRGIFSSFRLSVCAKTLPRLISGERRFVYLHFFCAAIHLFLPLAQGEHDDGDHHTHNPGEHQRTKQGNGLTVAITRHVVLTHEDPWSNLASVACIAGLFAIRRYLIRRSELKEEMVETE